MDKTTTFKKYWKQIVILLALVIAALGALIYFRVVWFVYPDRTAYPIRGIDVARYQGDIDWEKVSKDDVSFAYIKATEAEDLVDSRFIENAKEAREAGLDVGAYHFFSLRYGGEIQAQNFVANVSTSSVNLPPVIDLEYVGNSKMRPTKKEFQKELMLYVDTVTQRYHREPIFYTTYDFYNDYLYPEFENHPIWIRDVFSKPNANIKNWVLWQYNPHGKVEGIEGPVDLNVLNPDAATPISIKGADTEVGAKPVPQGMMLISVYIQDKEAARVSDCRITQKVSYQVPKTSAVADASLKLLFEGELANYGVYKSVSIENGVAKVMLRDAMGPRGYPGFLSSCEKGHLLGVLNDTLKQYPTITSVEVHSPDGKIEF